LAFWHFGKLVDGQPAKMPTERTCRQATALSSGGTAGMTNDFGFGILASWLMANLPKCQPSERAGKPPPCHRVEQLA
jgi:hypothetical protein